MALTDTIKRIDECIFSLEKIFVAWGFVVIGIVVFLDVIHRELALPASPLTWVLRVGGSYAFIYFALYWNHHKWGVPKLAGVSAVALAVICAAIAGFLKLVPNGLIWSQTLALAIMVWIGFTGASMAAHESRHLGLDIGPQLWPEHLRPKVFAVGYLLTSLFCMLLLVLAVKSVVMHFEDWVGTDFYGGTFPALHFPKWIAFLGIPYGLTVLSVRFIGSAIRSWEGDPGAADEFETYQKIAAKLE